MKHIGDFMTYVQELARKNDELMFPTHSLEEAAIVMAEILRHSNKEVKIYDHCLNGDISDKNYTFHSRLYQFLKKQKSIKIVLRSMEESNSKIFNDLAKYSMEFPGLIDLRVASTEFIENMEDVLTNDANFMVNDKGAFRLELSERNTEQSDTVDAVCCFNNEMISKRLNDAFDLQFGSCKRISIPAFV